MSALIWLIGALVLVGGELLIGDLVLLMLAGGAFAAAGTAFFFTSAAWVPVVVFAGVSTVLLTTLRPVARRHMISGPPVPDSIASMPGRHAVVVERVDDMSGRVKIDGEIWSARTDQPGQAIEAGDDVMILKIDGATAVVWKE